LQASWIVLAARWLHRLFQRGEVGGGVVAGAPVGAKEALGDAVDALVGALRGEDRRHEEVERARPVELVARVRVLRFQPIEQDGDRRFHHVPSYREKAAAEKRGDQGGWSSPRTRS